MPAGVAPDCTFTRLIQPASSSSWSAFRRAAGPTAVVAHHCEPAVGDLGPVVWSRTRAAPAACSRLITVAKSPPDGYTIIMFGPLARPDPLAALGADLRSGQPFAPVSRIVIAPPNLLVVVADPAGNDDLARVHRLRQSQSRQGHLRLARRRHALASLRRTVQARWPLRHAHVPYRGVAAGAMSDLLAGRIDAMFNTTGSLLQAARVGPGARARGRPPQRSPPAPELPTIAELGVPGYDFSSWYGLFAPAQDAAEIVRKMQRRHRHHAGRGSDQGAARAARRRRDKLHAGGSFRLMARIRHRVVGPGDQGGEHQGRLIARAILPGFRRP